MCVNQSPLNGGKHLCAPNGTPFKRALWECCENYLSVGQKRYSITLSDSRNLHLHASIKKEPWVLTALKILSYATLIIPLAALLIRAAFRNCSSPTVPPINILEKVDAVQWFKDLSIDTKKFEKNELFSNEVISTLVFHRFPGNVRCPKATAVQEQLIGKCKQILHANKIQMADGSNYIATQAPAEATKELFWKTCLSSGTSVIVDLTNDSDRKRDATVISYHPDEVQESMKYGSITVTCTDKVVEENRIASTYMVSDIDQQQTHTMTRVHYLKWEDHAVAASKDLHHLIEHVDGIAGDAAAPVTVHCRAGVGRTGSFITARTLNHLHKMGQLDQKNFKDQTSKAILSGREARGPLFVQAEQQLQGLIDYGQYLLKNPN